MTPPFKLQTVFFWGTEAGDGRGDGSHIPLGIGCTFTLAIGVPIPRTAANPRVSLVKHFLGMSHL
jgi:hypothetical protein